MALDITSFLLSAQSPDATIRSEAESNLLQLQEQNSAGVFLSLSDLRQFQVQNAAGFFLSLSVELSNDSKPIKSLRLAGIVLKNELDAKDSSRKEHLVQQWVAIDASIKSQIKESLLRTLRSVTHEAWHTAAQVIAKIAGIEVPRKEWPDLIGFLLNNMTQPESPASLKQATLETLGYVCEEISHEELEQSEVDAILTAVVQGMNLTQHTSEVRLAATRALNNVLGFAQTNFENEMEQRNFVMKVVCETTTSQEFEIRLAAYECLVAIATMYYEVLEPYMQTLFELTSKAVREDEETVALQAIEFWSSICDEEIGIQDSFDLQSGQSESPQPRCIKKALPFLVPMLLETILKQEEDQDQDDSIWNLSMSGGTCLGLVARTVGDAIVPHVMPFVEANITSSEWRCREAATYAFGSILEGPSFEKLCPLVPAVLDFMLEAMEDQNNHVKDTTAWTLSRIFELLHCPTSGFLFISASNLQQVLDVLLEGAKDVPNVAQKACGAIYYLAQGFEDVDSSSFSLTPYLTDILFALIFATEGTDPADSKLRSSAYETLNEVVRCAKVPETAKIIEQLLHFIMNKMSQSFDLWNEKKKGELQAHLCGVLQVIIQKLSNSDDTKLIVIQVSDQIMLLFLKIFAGQSSTVLEEAMLAIGALAYAIGPDFDKYMYEFYKYLEMGLQNFEEYKVFLICVGLVGDICLALGDKVLPYCDGIMACLSNIWTTELDYLWSTKLHRSVKPLILSCFGDIALAIRDQFENYLIFVIPMMQQSASEVCAHMDTNDDEIMDYGNLLRQSIFEAYSRILQGFKDAKPDLLIPLARPLLQILEIVFRHKQRDEGVTKAGIAVLGDLADALGPNAKIFLKDFSFCADFITECLESCDLQFKSTAMWSQSMIGLVIDSCGEAS